MAQPALAAANVQDPLGLQRQDGLDDRSIGDQAPAFDALLTHRSRPGIGIGLQALLKLFPVVALHADSLHRCALASLAGLPAAAYHSGNR